MIKVREEMKDMMPSDLVEICLQLNQIDHLDIENMEIDICKEAFSLLHSSLFQLKQEEIISILMKKRVKTNFVSMFPMYMDLMTKIFNSIK